MQDEKGYLRNTTFKQLNVIYILSARTCVTQAINTKEGFF